MYIFFIFDDIPQADFSMFVMVWKLIFVFMIVLSFFFIYFVFFFVFKKIKIYIKDISFVRVFELIIKNYIV